MSSQFKVIFICSKRNDIKNMAKGAIPLDFFFLLYFDFLDISSGSYPVGDRVAKSWPCLLLCRRLHTQQQIMNNNNRNTSKPPAAPAAMIIVSLLSIVKHINSY